MSFSYPFWLLDSSGQLQFASSNSETPSNGEDDMAVIDEYQLDRINKERKKAGLPPLTRVQAAAAVSRHEMERRERNDSSDFSIAHFLISYTIGIPMPSAAGIAGAMMHTPSKPVTDVNYDPPQERSAPSQINDGHSSSKSGDDSPAASSSSSSYDSSPSSSDSGGGGGGGE